MKKRSFPVDVIILTKNRYSQLLRCVTYLAFNNVTPKRIVLVDSTPSEGVDQTTISILREVAHLKKIIFLYRKIPDKSIAYARNQGILLTKSKYFAYLDDDEIASPNWIETIQRLFSKNLHQLVITGTLHPSQLDNYWNKVSEVIYGTAYHFEGRAEFAVGGNTAFNRQILKKIYPLFDERMLFSGEDWMFSQKWIGMGGNIFHSYHLKVRHDCRTSLSGTFQQWVRNGLGGYQLFFYRQPFEKKYFFYFPLFAEYFTWSKSMFRTFRGKKASLYFGLAVILFAYFFGLVQGIFFLNSNAKASSIS